MPSAGARISTRLSRAWASASCAAATFTRASAAAAGLPHDALSLPWTGHRPPRRQVPAGTRPTQAFPARDFLETRGQTVELRTQDRLIQAGEHLPLTHGVAGFDEHGRDATAFVFDTDRNVVARPDRTAESHCRLYDTRARRHDGHERQRLVACAGHGRRARGRARGPHDSDDRQDQPDPDGRPLLRGQAAEEVLPSVDIERRLAAVRIIAQGRCIIVLGIGLSVCTTHLPAELGADFDRRGAESLAAGLTLHQNRGLTGPPLQSANRDEPYRCAYLRL